jgi:hypothetical protein
MSFLRNQPVGVISSAFKFFKGRPVSTEKIGTKMDGFSAAKFFNLLQEDAVDFHNLRLPKGEHPEDGTPHNVKRP